MTAEQAASAPIELRIRGAMVAETMTYFPVLRENVSLEVARGEVRESFLFVRGMFIGPASALARLRTLLAERVPAEVTLTSHDELAGLYGKPVTAMELVLDPEGALGG